MEPTNTELFTQPTNRVLRLEFLPSPALTFEEHFNTNFKLDLDRFGYFVEKYAGLTRAEGFEVQKSGSNINITPGTLFYKQFIVQETSLTTATTFVAEDRKLILRITQSKKTAVTDPSDINITIGSKTFSGPNQYVYSISYLYTTGSVPSNTSSDFYIYLADISATGVVTQKIELLSERRSWNFLKLTDTPDTYTIGKAIRVKADGTGLEYFDAALLSHNHDDRYFTEAEVTAALLQKSDVGHNHDDRYFTEAEVTAALDLKSNVGHNHDLTYYPILEVDALIASRAPASHAHLISNITNLTEELANRSLVTHSHTILSLTDVPDAFVANKVLRVNSAGNAVEFANPKDTLLSLTDTPYDFSASTQTGKKFLRVNAAGNSTEFGDALIQARVNSTNHNVYQLEFVSSSGNLAVSSSLNSGDSELGAALKIDLNLTNPITNLTSIPGFPANFTNQKQRLVKVNSSENGVEFGPVVHDITNSSEGSFLVWGKSGELSGITTTAKIREIVGRSGMGVDILGTSQLAGDLVFKTSSQGIILQDSAIANASYRLGVTNGKLVLIRVQTNIISIDSSGGNSSTL